MKSILLLISLTVFAIFLLDFTGIAQRKDQCGTMLYLEAQFKKNPSLRDQFKKEQAAFNKKVEARMLQAPMIAKEQATPIVIPIVFHIVLTNPSAVTDAMILAQLDTLNHDIAGMNGDSTRIPSYFKPFFGHSNFQFCLAKQNPNGDPTTGIERTTTTVSAFGVNGKMKHTVTGGADAWNTNNYYNVWVCNMSNNILGYGTFPGTAPAGEDGAVVSYGSLPGGIFTDYNLGKTLTHETGHYLNLIHIWGDDNGACWGTDYVDDTPNQGNYTSGCPSGVVTDSCSPNPPGIMYQNYMDYSSDPCLVMFTNGQVTRMQTAFDTYRTSLLSSNGCKPVVLKNYDAAMRAIVQPNYRICNPSFIPTVTLYNRGTQTLTSVTINAQIDNGPVVTTNWTGSLASITATNVTLSSLNTSEGIHTLTVFTSNPDGVADQNPSNDTIRTSIMYYPPFNSPISESFEGNTFPPTGWDIVNPDNYFTWQKANGVGFGDTHSVFMDNYDYAANDQKDYLRLPEVNIGGADSVFLSFQVAAATYTALNTPNNTWDTLQVLVSTDCGNTYTSVYKKWASTLVTRQTATTSYFVPAASEWRKDSIDLSSFANGNSKIMVAFLNTEEFENNIYLDDINLRTVTINPNLKARGVLVTPNPTRGQVAVQFYPQPLGLRAILLYNSVGQKVQETIVEKGYTDNYYGYDLSRYPAGLYIVKIVFEDHVVTKKIVLTR
jgi:hypothetical protein